MERNKTRQDPIDEALEASFPASDPPAWNMGHDPLATPPPRSAGRGTQGESRGARRRRPAGKA